MTRPIGNRSTVGSNLRRSRNFSERFSIGSIGSYLKTFSFQVTSERKGAKDSSASQPSVTGSSCGKPDHLDLDVDDVTDNDVTDHVNILRDTVKNLTQTVCQLSDENNRLLKENKQLKKQMKSKTITVVC